MPLLVFTYRDMLVGLTGFDAILKGRKIACPRSPCSLRTLGYKGATGTFVKRLGPCLASNPVNLKQMGHTDF